MRRADPARAPNRFAVYPSLAGKRVLVTGGASGIGADMVEQFSRQGSRVAFLDIDDTAARGLLHRIRKLHRRVPIYIHCDLRDVTAIRQAIAGLRTQLRGFDVLVNNAARDDRHAFESLEPGYWDECLAINLRHQIFTTQAVIPDMRRSGGGSIILLGSVAWMRGRPGFIGYTTAKAGINGATRTLARELGPYRIRVNSILPGLVVTERARRLWFTKRQIAQFVKNQALRFALEPCDVTRMALFLAADDSRACTGQNFIVDAGVSLN